MTRERSVGVVMLGALALVATLLLVPSLAVLGADAGQDNGDRCARFALQSQARTRIVHGEGPVSAVLGDSYAVGLGLRDPARSWPARLPGQVRVHGFSGSGFAAGSSPCHRASFAERARRLPDAARTVIVQGGLNDVDRPEDEVVAGLLSVLGTLEGRRVLVVGPVRAPVRAQHVARVDALLARECRQAGVAYLSNLDRDLPFLSDGLHLTAAGHTTLGRVVAARLRGLSGVGD